MFPLLVKTHILSARNIVRDTWQRRPLVAVGLGLLGGGLFLLVYLGFYLFLLFARSLHSLHETVFQIFYFLFLFLLAGAVPFVASTLLHSADYVLLFASPVPPRTVIAAKLLDATVTNSLQFLVLGIPAIVACAAVLKVPWWAWGFVLILVLLFVLLPALITALGLLIALAIIGIRRLRAAIGLLNAVMALVVCVTIVLEARHIPFKPGLFSGALTVLPPNAEVSYSVTAHVAPSGWFASALLALTLQKGYTLAGFGGYLSLISGVVGVLYAVCMALGARLLTAPTVAEESGETVPTNGGRSAGKPGWLYVFPAPVAAILRKDFHYLVRDSVLLSQVVMPMILFLVPFLLAIQERSFRMREEIYPFASMMIGVILFMQTSILSLSSIGLENRSFWVLMTSPHSGLTLLWSKFLMSTLFSGGVGILLSCIAGLFFSASLAAIGVQCVLIGFSAAGLCGLGVGISAALPRFVYENPAHRVSAWALILGFFASVGYLAVIGGLYGIIAYITMHTEEAATSLLFWLGAMLLHLALTGLCVYFPLLIGAHRIEQYQWEH
jgi:ABC-2 type transport system permease protein